MNCLSFLSVALNSIIHRNYKKDSKVLLSFTFLLGKKQTFACKSTALLILYGGAGDFARINSDCANVRVRSYAYELNRRAYG